MSQFVHYDLVMTPLSGPMPASILTSYGMYSVQYMGGMPYSIYVATEVLSAEPHVTCHVPVQYRWYEPTDTNACNVVL